MEYTNFISIGAFRFIRNETVITFAIIVIGIFLYFDLYSKSSEENESKLFPLDPSKPLPNSASKMQYFKKAVVSADAGACAKIGRDILGKKGSAVDAAIAALICNSVVNMQSAGVGGGFFMTIFRKSEKKVYCLNARETAPIQASNDLYKNKENKSRNGSLSVGVPGEIRGYWTAHQKFGKLPWKDLVQPTIDLCDNGYVMTKHQHWSTQQTKLKNDENLRNWFYDESGNLKKPGSKIYPKKLCDFLQKLSVHGPEDFYTGQLSRMFIKDIKDIGGIITEKDMVQYKAEWQEPIHVNLKNGDHFYSFPPPGSGALIAFILNILSGYNFTRGHLYRPDAATTYHRIIESFKFAFAQRSKLGDPKFVNTKSVVEELLSEDFARRVRLKIRDHKTSYNPTYYGAKFIMDDDHGTSHVSVLDQNGDAVAVTSSVNFFFGAGCTSKRSGFILNSVMDDFSFPYLVNYFGLPASKANEIEPCKRPLSSMAPSILLDSKGNVKIVIGAAGGPHIITGMALTLLRILWFGDNLKEAIDTSRVHHQLIPMKITYEYGLLDETVKNFQKLGHKIERSSSKSIIYAILKEKNNIIGITDLRKDGGGVYGIDSVDPPILG